jgi:hypothetical protein
MRGSSGYAIAEVLVAVVIISISFIELSRAVSRIMRSANQTILLGKSISVTHSTMEEVMAQSFDAKGSEAGGHALEFDGIDDYILLSEVIDIGSTSSTVSMWVKVPVVGEGNLIADERVGILLGNQWRDPYSNWEIHDDGQIRILWNKGEKTLFGSSDLRDGKWHHIAFVRDVENDSLKGYVDGVAEIVENDAGTDLTFGNEFYVGWDHRQKDVNPANDYRFHGLIDELQIWDIARTQAQIIADYKTGITNPFNNSNLKLYLRMNNGIGTTVFDHSSNKVHSPITSATWTDQSSSWSTTLGTEGEASWSDYDDVDDFNGVDFTDDYYTGITGTITVEYVSVHQDTWAISTVAGPTDYKQVTVRVNIPGGDAYTQLRAVKSAKTIQHYALTYSPYGN